MLAVAKCSIAAEKITDSLQILKWFGGVEMG